MVYLTVKQSGTPVPNKVYIGTTHEPIQAAIDYAHSQGGGTVFVEHGVYLINNTANTGLPSGLGKWGLKLYSNIKLSGEYFGTVLKPDFANDSDGCVISILGQTSAAGGEPLENIVVENLLIGGGNVNGGDVGGRGIVAYNCGLGQTAGLANGGYDSSTVGRDKPNKLGIEINGCYFEKLRYPGIYTDTCSNFSISDNISLTMEQHSMYLVASKNFIVKNCYACNSFTSGISAVSNCRNFLVNDSIVQNNQQSGIECSNSKSYSFSGVISVNNRYDGIYHSYGSAVTQTGSISANNGQRGIFISNGSNTDPCNATLSTNITVNNLTQGISLNKTKSAAITGNISFQNTGNDIESNLSTGYVTITGNAYKTFSNGGSNNVYSNSYNQQVS